MVLEVFHNANSPNWDIASTCKISGVDGLVLIEAKAHQAELSHSGKTRPTTLNGWKNHNRIGCAISEASAELQFATQSRWALSRDLSYQMSNRFTWAWKLASMGIPVVLVYLGFLNAYEMEKNSPIFKTHQSWAESVKGHSEPLFKPAVWGKPVDIDGTPIISIIRSTTERFYSHELHSDINEGNE